VQDLLQHLINGIGYGSIYALIALGYTMVYGILQLINFAHAEVYMVGAYAAFYGARWLGIDNSPGLSTLAVLLVFSMVACSLLSLIIERFAYRPLRNAPKVNVLITAIGVSLLLQFLAQVIFGAQPRVFPNVLENQTLMSIGDVHLKTNDVAVFVVSIGAMVVLHFLIYHTRLGRAMRAVSANPTVASLMGIQVTRVVAFTFVVGSSLAGIGSVLVGMRYPKIDPLMGMMIGLKAFVAAVVGGIGSIPGAVLGGLIMGLSEELVVGYLSSTLKDAIAFGLLILILLLRPSGLFGKSLAEKV
jgi:branched-chain amino acid transport system permease protein